MSLPCSVPYVEGRMEGLRGLTQMAGLQGCMFSGAALAVILITDHNPLDALGLVVPGCGWDRPKLPSGLHACMASLSGSQQPRPQTSGRPGLELETSKLLHKMR